MASTMGVAVRGSQGLYMLEGACPNMKSEDSGFEALPLPNCKVMKFDPEGRRFAYSDGKIIKIFGFEGKKWAEISSLTPFAGGRVTFLEFSPQGNILAAWAVFAKSGSGNEDHNVRLFEAGSGRECHAYTHKKGEGWAPQWTQDEGWCAHRMVNNEIVFFRNNDFSDACPARISIKNLDSFYLSPKTDPGGESPRVACYLPGQKGGPGFCKIFAYPNFDPERHALATKSFMTADKMEAKWSPSDGRSCLVLAQSEVDKTGSSYYGRSQLHFANIDGDTALVSLDKDGPVYSVDWKPSKPPQFLVVYGYMPAKATLFNRKCETVFDLATGPRNMAIFNPMGNLALVGGFGNLRGNIEIWDIEGHKKVAQFEAEDATDVRWAPDGQHILTSTCAPRLRTGNGFRIWHYTSSLMYESILVNKKAANDTGKEAIAAPTVDELWEVAWRPCPPGTFPDKFPILTKPIEGGMTSKTPQASKQAYRPPGARGRPGQAPPGAPAPDGNKKPVKLPVGMSQASQDPKKTNKAKGKKANQGAANGTANPATAQPTPQPSSLATEREKETRKLQKKIQDIEKLKVRLANGETLETNQLDKIKKEAELLSQLKKLQV